MTSRKTLLLDNGTWSVIPQVRLLFVFELWSELIGRLQTSIDGNESFELIVPSAHLKDVLDPNILDKISGSQVYVYYTDETQRVKDEQRYRANQSNMNFCHARAILTKLNGYGVDEGIQEPGHLNNQLLGGKREQLVKSVAEKRLSEHDHSPISSKKQAVSRNMYLPTRGSDLQNSVFSEEFVHLSCQHSIANTCINVGQNIVLCPTCGALTSFAASQNGTVTENLRDQPSTPLLFRSRSSRATLPAYEHRFAPTHPTQKESLQSKLNRCITGVNNARAAIRQMNERSVIANNTMVNIKQSCQDIVELYNKAAIEWRIYAEQLEKTIHSFDGITEDKIIVLPPNTIEWIISSVGKKQMNALCKYQKSIFSPPFYMPNSGHKMRLRLYLNGDYNALNRFISLFSVIVRSDTDAQLDWPFSHRVTLSLVDQAPIENDRLDIVRTFIPNPSSSCFQRPNIDMNFGYGFKEFLSIQDFNRNQSRYVLHDTMLIRLQLDPIASNSELVFVRDADMVPNDDDHPNNVSSRVHQNR